MTSGGNNFPGLSRTLNFNFQDFPGPGILKKKSRTFQDFPGGVGTLSLTNATCPNKKAQLTQGLRVTAPSF